jgi:DNA-binding NarL/FixJ family response regulator
MAVAENLTVMVVDDHELFRDGLAMVLAQRGFEVIGAVGSATEALAQIAEHRPDVVLMDLSLPGMSGIEATRRLTAAEPPVPVVALTVVASGPQVIEAFQAGAWGYLLKDASIDQIVDAIRAAVRNESVLSPRVAARVVAWLREPQGTEPATAAPQFSDRQLEILELVAKGVSNQQIASTLFLSEHTVKTHVSSILLKLDANNRVQAAVRAVHGRIV